MEFEQLLKLIEEGRDIFTNEMINEETKCTKVTGQQSSSRSDKKYMRCVKTPTGYKRVHYGDPNLRIKKSNPKKRKAFRARHKCSQKKDKTSPGYWSCKNW